MFAEEEVISEFRNFGKKMRIIAFCAILLFIPFVNIVAVIILYIKAVSSLGNIKRINKKSKNKNLKLYRSYFLISYVILLIGLIILVLLLYNLYLDINRIMEWADDDREWAQDMINEAMYDFQRNLIMLTLIVSLFMSIPQILAWNNLTSFFKDNGDIFPFEIANDAKSGSNLLKIAVIINTVAAFGGIFVFYLIFLGIVVYILQFIGYFNLSALRNLYEDKAQSATPRAITVEDNEKNFCPNCGNSLANDKNFCSSCGTKL